MDCYILNGGDLEKMILARESWRFYGNCGRGVWVVLVFWDAIFVLVNGILDYVVFFFFNLGNFDVVFCFIRYSEGVFFFIGENRG